MQKVEVGPRCGASLLTLYVPTPSCEAELFHR